MKLKMTCIKFQQNIKKPKFWTFEVFRMTNDQQMQTEGWRDTKLFKLEG